MKFSGMMVGTCLFLMILGDDASPKPGLPLTPSCCPWPVRGVPPSVMNTVSALQMYGSKPGFHHGLDLQAPAGTKIYAPVSGVVATRYYYKKPSPYTYEVSITTENGYRWEFHHIDAESIPLDIRQLAEQRGVVHQGAVLGDIYDASHLNIPPHVHINVIDAEGYYHDPLKFFPSLADPQPPVIKGIYLVDDRNHVVAAEETREPRRQRVTLGNYELVVDALDEMPPSKIGQPVYRMEVFVEVRQRDTSPRTGQMASTHVDRLPEKDFLSGVQTIYKLDPIIRQDGTPLTNQVEAAKPRKFLFRFPLEAALLAPMTEVGVNVVAYDYAGNKDTCRMIIMLE
jgi:hypothetical protein